MGTDATFLDRSWITLDTQYEWVEMSRNFIGGFIDGLARGEQVRVDYQDEDGETGQLFPSTVELLWFLVEEAARLYSYASMLNPVDPDVCRGMRLGAEAGAALFGLAINAEGVVIAGSLGGTAVELTAVGPHVHADADSWTDTFNLAAICRHYDVLDLLCAVPSLFLKASGASEAAETMIEAFRALWLQSKDGGLGSPGDPGNVAKLFSRAIAAAQAERQEDDDLVGYVEKIIVPELNVARFIAEGDQEGFSQSLATGLASHQQYWSTDGREDQPLGIFSVGLLALTSLAHDRSMVIDHSAEFCPRWLFEGGCRIPLD